MSTEPKEVEISAGNHSVISCNLKYSIIIPRMNLVVFPQIIYNIINCDAVILQQATPTGMPSLSRNGTTLLELKKRHVSQSLNELQIRLGRMRQCQQHDSQSKVGTTGHSQAESSPTQLGQRQHYPDIDGSSPANGLWKDSIPASQSPSQKPVMNPSHYKLVSHISDPLRTEAIQRNNPVTLRDRLMLQNQLHFNLPGQQKLNKEIIIESAIRHPLLVRSRGVLKKIV